MMFAPPPADKAPRPSMLAARYAAKWALLALVLWQLERREPAQLAEPNPLDLDHDHPLPEHDAEQESDEPEQASHFAD